MRWVVQWLGGLGMLAALAAHVHAEPLRACLHWQRPAGTTCIGQQALEQQVEALLGREAFVAAADADLLLNGRIEARGATWLATLSVIDEGGQVRAVRELRSEQDDCAALNSAIVVVLSTLFEAPSSDGLGAAASREGAEADRPSSLSFGAGAHAEMGTLPGVYAGPSLLLHAHLRALAFVPIWLEASWFPGVERLDSSSQGARFNAAQLGASVCPELALGRWTAALCAGARGGIVHAQGEQLSVERDPVRGLFQLTPGAALTFMVSTRVGLRLALAGALNLIRPRIYYERGDGSRAELHRPSLFGGGAGISLIIGAR